jgi:uncharacterized protein
MSTPTAAAQILLTLVERHRGQIDAVLERYGARNPRIFGSVARGEAGDTSDIDLLVDLDDAGNPLLRVAGIGEELTAILGVRVDVVSDALLRDSVSMTAIADSVSL